MIDSTKKKGLSTGILIFFLFIFIANNSVAQLAQWGSTWTGTQASPLSASTTATNISAATVTRTSLTGQSSTNRYNSSNWISASNYLTVTVTPSAGFVLNLNSQTLVLTMGSSGTGPTGYLVYSSVNSFAASIGTLTTSTSGVTSNQTITLPSTGYNSLSGITFRIVSTTPYTSNAAGTGGFGTLTVNGAVAAVTPTINPATNTFTAFTTTYGAASTAQTVSVTGTNLTAAITATAGTGFEVSNGGAYGASTTFTQSGGNASGTLSVRLKASAAVSASYNSITAVSLTSTGATARNYTTAATGNSVSARALTITGLTANNKNYNGLTATTLGGTPAYAGLQNGETFTVTGIPSANFNTPAAGAAKTVTVTGYTAPNTNYTVSQPTGLSATINTAALTITGVTANSKPYDGFTTTTLSGTPAYVGLQNGESFSVTGTPVANFNTPAVGTGKTVTVTGYTAPNANYTVSQPTGLTANILGAGIGTADFRSKANGNFSSFGPSGAWEYDQGGGSWTDATQAPVSSNNVSITHNIIVDQDYTTGAGKTLFLGTGGILTVNPARRLTVAGTADFNNKPVTFLSGISGTASLGEVTGTVSNATNVTVERYIPDNGFRSWRLLSVPTYGSGQTIKQAWQEGDANPLPLQNNLPGYGTQISGTGYTAAAQAAGFDTVAALASLLTWTGSAWAAIPATNVAIATQQSYFLFIRGERSKGVTGNNSNSSATTLRTHGTIYTGDQVNNVGAGAFALIPNLYPSAISFTGLTRTGGVNNLFYIWDSKKINGNSLGMYQTFSSTNSFNCMISGGSYTLGQPNTIIQSGQSFFVTSGAAGTITLKESAKVNNGSSLGFRPAPSVVKTTIDTRLYNSNKEMLDAATVVFDAVYSKAVSEEDAPKMGNPGANFAIEAGSKLLAIEGTLPVQEGDVIQYRMWNLTKGNYELELEASNLDVAEGLTAVLEDSYLKTNTVINLTANTNVKFAVDGNAASSSANRFRIVFAKTKTAVAGTKQLFTIAPNPVENGLMNLQFKNQQAGRYAITLVNNNGQEIFKKSIVYAGGNGIQVLNLPTGIAEGVYTVIIVSPGKNKTTQAVFINANFK